MTKEHPHDITVAFGGPIEKGLLMSKGPGRSTFSYRPGRRPMEGKCSELLGSVRGRAPNICRGSFEHLIASSEHLDTLREIARLVGSVRKAPKKAVYRSREAQTHICEGCYSRLVREGNARVGVR